MACLWLTNTHLHTILLTLPILWPDPPCLELVYIVYKQKSLYRLILAYSEISIVLNLVMQDYSNRQGQLRWRAVMWQDALDRKKLPVYWPSVPLCVPFSCTELHYLQVAQGSATLGESDYISLQNNHIKTHKSGNLTWGKCGWGWGPLEVKIQQCHYIRVG